MRRGSQRYWCVAVGRLLCTRRQGGAVHGVVGHPPPRVDERPREDQLGEARRPPCRVRRCDGAAPRVSEHDEAVEAEVRAQRVDLGEVARHVPVLGVVGPLGTARIELVVEDELPRGRERRERVEVVMAQARTAVNDEHRRFAFAPLSNDTVPNAAARHSEVAL